jgi:histidinol-phosphate phosphatase family protein
MKKTIVCIDRDGTLIHDEMYHLFLGKDNDWPSKVRILPGVIDGLKKLRDIPGVSIYMITNQAGVAIKDYPLLTIEKAHEVCRYVLYKIKKQGAVIDDYFLCPHATPEYVSTKPGVSFDDELVYDCECLKPSLGMVFDAFKAENVTADNANIYVIGDRATDVLTALNINGFGILIPFAGEPGEEDTARKLEGQSHIYIANDLLHAAEFIVERQLNIASR